MRDQQFINFFCEYEIDSNHIVNFIATGIGQISTCCVFSHEYALNIRVQ